MGVEERRVSVGECVICRFIAGPEAKGVPGVCWDHHVRGFVCEDCAGNSVLRMRYAMPRHLRDLRMFFLGSQGALLASLLSSLCFGGGWVMLLTPMVVLAVAYRHVLKRLRAVTTEELRDELFLLKVRQ